MYIAGESKDTKSKRRIELCPEEWDDSFGEGFYEHTLENGFYYIAPNSEWNPQAGCVLAPGINQSTPESPAQLQLKINELRREKIPTMDNYQLEHYFSDSTNIDTSQDDPEVLVNLAGYQVTKAELFAHTREPAITIWENRIKFNMACLRRFPGVTHIQILIHPEQKRLIIRPCESDAPDSLRWAKGGGEKDISNRDMLCKIFAAKVFDLMGWDTQYRYKMMGKPAVCDGEMLYLFKLTDFELFINSRKTKSYLPGDWREYFGTPVEKHEDSYRIDLADGYITTDKA